MNVKKAEKVTATGKQEERRGKTRGQGQEADRFIVTQTKQVSERRAESAMRNQSGVCLRVLH